MDPNKFFQPTTPAQPPQPALPPTPSLPSAPQTPLSSNEQPIASYPPYTPQVIHPQIDGQQPSVPNQTPAFTPPPATTMPLPPPPPPVGASTLSSAASDPYGFITGVQKPTHKGFHLGNGNMPVTIGLIVGAAAILIIVIILIGSLFSGGSNTSKANLKSLAQTQNEIVRISAKAESAAVTQPVKNLAITIDMSLSSQQQEVLKVLSRNGVKMDKKELQLTQDGTTDQRLTNAKNTNTFDKEYAAIMQTSLQKYVAALRNINATAKSKTERDLSSQYITQTELLIAQIPNSQPQE